MLSFTTLASGSDGNAMLVRAGDTCILMDAGISCRRITAALAELGVDPADLAAVLITHEHSDHICGLATLTKRYSIPVYASQATADRLREQGIPESCLHPFAAGSSFFIGSVCCTSFSTPHDAVDSVGYTVQWQDSRLALVTDLGHVTDTVRRAVLGSQAVVLESNHDEQWLRSGTYPYYLKQRILGARGHLCNEAGADFAAQAVQAGAHTVVLAHLSKENNTPARAYDVLCRRLAAMGIDPEREITVAVAPRAEKGQTYTVDREGVPC